MANVKKKKPKLGIFETKCLRTIFRIRRQQHEPNKEVLEKSGADPISEGVYQVKSFSGLHESITKEMQTSLALRNTFARIDEAKELQSALHIPSHRMKGTINKSSSPPTSLD